MKKGEIKARTVLLLIDIDYHLNVYVCDICRAMLRPKLQFCDLAERLNISSFVTNLIMCKYGVCVLGFR